MSGFGWCRPPAASNSYLPAPAKGVAITWKAGKPTVSQPPKYGSPTCAINWREWNQEAFLAARREAKPVLLTLTATWCHWCHVMDETSYSDQLVINLVNSRFISVRVDADQRPDVSRRYNQGGLPSVAILDGQGNLLAGQVYTPPDQMVQFLEQVIADDSPAGLVTQRPSNKIPRRSVQPQVKEFSSSTSNLVLRRLQELYDPEYGGFGREPKQPPWEGLRCLMALYSRSGDKHLLRMITNTLEGMRIGLHDQKDQGFFRYSVSRDWRVPHYEKMAVTNANLASLYLEAYQLTGRRAFRDVAVGAIGYLLGPLFDKSRSVFYASQDASENYYRLPWKDREDAPKPAIDGTVYTGWNALVATTLINASGILGNSNYLRIATDVLDRLWNSGRQWDQGLCHVLGGPPEQPKVLEDHVQYIRALLAHYQITGQPERLQQAVKVAMCIKKLFLASDGGFHDGSETIVASDKLLHKEKPVLENSLLAEALLSIFCFTGEDEHHALAQNTLATFESVVPRRSYMGPDGSRRMEEDEEELFLPAGSAWARAMDMMSSGPVQLLVVGAPSDSRTRSLISAALKTYAPHRLVQLLDPERDRALRLHGWHVFGPDYHCQRGEAVVEHPTLGIPVK